MTTTSKAPDWRAARNARVADALVSALPPGFPAHVRRHTLAQRYIVETPGRAVEAYWRAHPLRADKLARALAAASGAPAGWTWRAGSATAYRLPPAPYREDAYAKGAGTCCLCGQAVFRYGWHRDFDGRGPSPRATWHQACVAAWKLWTAPALQEVLLAKRQRRRCALGGGVLRRGDREVDHRVPLYRVWRDERSRPWPELLAFWGAPNLQVIGRAAHAAKCEEERQERSEFARSILRLAA